MKTNLTIGFFLISIRLAVSIIGFDVMKYSTINTELYNSNNLTGWYNPEDSKDSEDSVMLPGKKHGYKIWEETETEVIDCAAINNKAHKFRRYNVKALDNEEQDNEVMVYIAHNLLLREMNIEDPTTQLDKTLSLIIFNYLSRAKEVSDAVKEIRNIRKSIFGSEACEINFFVEKFFLTAVF